MRLGGLEAAANAAFPAYGRELWQACLDTFFKGSWPTLLPAALVLPAVGS